MTALHTDLPGNVGQRLEATTMIESAEEFVRLRTGFDRDNILRSATEPAAARVWLEIIARYPTMRKWVAQNLTVSPEILDLLVDEEDREVRWQVSAKRNISITAQRKLVGDPDEGVRRQLAKNRHVLSDVLEVLAADGADSVSTAATETLAARGERARDTT